MMIRTKPDFKSTTCKTMEDYTEDEQLNIKHLVAQLERVLNIENGEEFIMMRYDPESLPGASIDVFSNAKNVHNLRSVAARFLSMTEHLAKQRSN